MNRDVTINTFEGGIDLDSDIRIVPSNKLRDAINVDMRRSGDVAALVDLKGETVKKIIEDLNPNKEVSFLAATSNTFFLIEPTSEKFDSIVFFYIKKDGVNYQFIISAFLIDQNKIVDIYTEQLSESDYIFLKDSTIDFVKMGQLGYDTIYFVDNRRQPRKLECLIERVNDNELTLLLDIVNDSTSSKLVTMDVISSGEISMPFRAYIYGYKLGGATRPSVINPGTETIKFVDFTEADTFKQVSFEIFEEDYGNWVFEIVYHRDGGNFYRNFVIGNPYQVNLPIGVLSSSDQLIVSTSIEPSVNQLDSWDFLYSGGVITLYKDNSSPGWNVGTKLYTTEIASPSNIAPDGYYQVPLTNTYVKVVSGEITEVQVNNGNVTFSVDPLDISSNVRAVSTFDEGNRNRLATLSYTVPQTITVSSEEYELSGITAGSKTSAGSNNWSFTLERKEELNVLASYLPTIVTLTATINDYVNTGSGYDVTFGVSMNRPISQDITVDVRCRAFDESSNNELVNATGSVTITAGNTINQEVSYYPYDLGNAYFTEPCISGHTYAGTETITETNPCSI